MVLLVQCEEVTKIK